MTWDHIPVTQKQPRKLLRRRKAVDIIDFDDELSAELIRFREQIRKQLNQLLKT